MKIASSIIYTWVALSLIQLTATAIAGNVVPTDCTNAAAVKQIADGVYLRPGQHAVVFEADNVANIGFVVGKLCVAVIDTGGSMAEGQALDCAIKSVTDTPVCYVINTHAHPDHILGNLAFKRDGIAFIGHAKLKRAIALTAPTYLPRAEAQAGRKLGESYFVLPTRTVDPAQPLKLDLGGRALRLSAHSTAHTDHDVSVFDEGTGTLWLSDLVFQEHTPAIAGSVNGWLKVLEQLSAQDAELAVPGHGPVGKWPATADATRRYLRILRDEVRAYIADGGDLAGAQEEIGHQEEQHWVMFDEFHRRNVASAFTELEWE